MTQEIYLVILLIMVTHILGTVLEKQADKKIERLAIGDVIDGYTFMSGTLALVMQFPISALIWLSTCVVSFKGIKK